MKKFALFLLVCTLMVMATGASIAAFDPCGTTWAFVSPYSNYTAVRAVIYPWGYTYPHTHSARAYIFSRSTGHTSDSGWKSGTGTVVAQTNSIHNNLGPFAGEAWFSCPTIS